MIKLLHLISNLNQGGAEIFMYRLVTGLNPKQFDVIVVSMTDTGPIGAKLLAAGIPVYALGMPKGLSDPRGIWRFFRLLNRFRPHMVQSWMYHANLLAALFAGRVPCIWNIRCSDMDLSRYNPTYRATVWGGALLSRIPRAIVVNSYHGQTHHRNLAYKPKKWRVLTNGFDTQLFRPSPEMGQKVRTACQIPRDTIVIGYIARWDPVKNHAMCFATAHRILRKFPQVHFLLAGRGICPRNRAVKRFIDPAPRPSNLHLLGESHAVPELLAALDIAVSTSWSEGLPNTIGEAMATGVPCVVTDVGDTRRLVGKTGIIVPPGDTEGFTAALLQLINTPRKAREQLGAAARKRIQTYFALSVSIQHYETLYHTLCNHDRS